MVYSKKRQEEPAIARRKGTRCEDAPRMEAAERNVAIAAAEVYATGVTGRDAGGIESWQDRLVGCG